MRKGKIKWQFKNFKIYKDLYGKPLNHDWVARDVFPIQILLIFSGRCNRYFWDIRVTIHRLPSLKYALWFLLTKCSKSELFLCLQKVNHVTSILGFFFMGKPGFTEPGQSIHYTQDCFSNSEKKKQHLPEKMITLKIMPYKGFGRALLFKGGLCR